MSARRSGPLQLAFALDHAESFARDDFLESPSNAPALAYVESWPDWPDQCGILVGPRGSGKSHLASIWAERTGARFLAARALDVGTVPGALATGALVVEDLAPDRFDERALFHLLNLVRQTGAWLLLSAHTAPAGWALGVADLASRLRVIPTLPLQPPDDALLRALIVKLFSDRQLVVDEALLSYLLSRIERSFPAARDVVEQLDREALRRKRAVSRALAAEIFSESTPLTPLRR